MDIIMWHRLAAFAAIIALLTVFPLESAASAHTSYTAVQGWWEIYGPKYDIYVFFQAERHTPVTEDTGPDRFDFIDISVTNHATGTTIRTNVEGIPLTKQDKFAVTPNQKFARLDANMQLPTGFLADGPPAQFRLNINWQAIPNWTGCEEGDELYQGAVAYGRLTVNGVSYTLPSEKSECAWVYFTRGR